MSDQYTPPGAKPYSVRPDSSRPDPSRPDLSRPDVRVNVSSTAPPVAAPSDTGFGSGILIAVVFVVVAIIAAAVFSNRDMFGTGAGDATPGVTIENNVAPVENAAPAAVAPAPADPAPAVAEPATPAPEVVDPVTPAPDAAAPEPVVPAAPANP